MEEVHHNKRSGHKHAIVEGTRCVGNVRGTPNHNILFNTQNSLKFGLEKFQISVSSMVAPIILRSAGQHIGVELRCKLSTHDFGWRCLHASVNGERLVFEKKV